MTKRTLTLSEARAVLIALGWTPPAQPAPGEPAEIASLPIEVRQLMHAADRIRDDWAEAAPPGQQLSARQQELWRDLHEASDKVWNRPAGDR